MKIVDLQVTISGLEIENDKSIDEFITKLEKLSNSNYVSATVLFEEEI